MSSAAVPFVSLALVLGLVACTTPEPAPSAEPRPEPDAEVEPTPEPSPEPASPSEPAAAQADAPSNPIASALQAVPAAVASTYLLSISEDRGELTIDPRPRPTPRAARSAGFSVKDSEAGGKIISLHGGPFLHGGWVRASFRERAPAERLDELRRAGYDVDQTRDLLVVDGENDPQPTLFAFSGDAAKPGIVGVCSEVTIIDFGPGSSPAPVAVRKPVLYLYPPEPTQVEVELELEGHVTSAYPALHDGSWSVTASPRGELVDETTGRSHRYLFWEGTSDGFELDPAKAHCLAREEVTPFLEQACERFALSAHECGDMITYWLPELTASPYAVLQFVDEDTYGRYARLTVTPEPDAVIRPFMIFRGSDVPVEVGAPPLPQRRRGAFTVIEWGGANLDENGNGNDRDHIHLR